VPIDETKPRTDPKLPLTGGGQKRENIIQVTDFAAGYGTTTILHDVSFNVRSGEILVIAGDSGCGKSTLLKHMIGLLNPTKGKISIDGDDLASAPDGPQRDKIISKFGVSFQGGALFGSMTILENVRLQLQEFVHLPGEMPDMIALTKLQLVGLADSAQQMPAELSGGMQKRAAIARALARDPRIVFMDEPSAGLDPITSAEMDQLILSLNKLLGTTFVIVSHELPSILNIAHRVLLFQKEKRTLVAEGDPRELGKTSKDAWVKAFFNREIPKEQNRPAQTADPAGQPAKATKAL
jgi:phospholipid/cholesterol/gamma-HCH transport system ATP-binding protein